MKVKDKVKEKKQVFDQNRKSQQQRLLAKLREKTLTTVEARHELDILEVAARIAELRHDYGYNIHTHWSNGDNPGGGRHRIAKYVLLPGKYEGKKK